jgi:hypothetical protein
MTDAYNAAILMIVLLASAAVGMLVRRLLPETHRSRESFEIVQLVITMLLTFAALVMGLLTVSVKNSFDTANNDMANLAAQIVQIDQLLREYGPETDPVRGMLRSYTASVIATTWPHETPPAGDFYLRNAPPNVVGGMESKSLGDALEGIGNALLRLDPPDGYHRHLAADCRSHFEALMKARWTVIEQARPIISRPFYIVMTVWLIVIFACFGLTGPRNGLVIAMIVLCAVSIASAVFVILDMDMPFNGFIMISSEPMRSALADISR